MFKKISLFLILFLIAFLSTFVFSQEDIEKIDNSYFPNAQRPTSIFFHDEHNENAQIDDCAYCHHVFDKDNVLIEDESSEDLSCSDCHGLKPLPENSIPLTKAFHKRCKTCHLINQKGPVMCGECHKKT